VSSASSISVLANTRSATEVLPWVTVTVGGLTVLLIAVIVPSISASWLAHALAGASSPAQQSARINVLSILLSGKHPAQLAPDREPGGRRVA
jgi:hypothetical protein